MSDPDRAALQDSDLVVPTSADDTAHRVPMLPHGEVEQARSYAEASRAASTLLAYARDWKAFTLWCRERRLAPLPADPRVVAVFLSAEAARGCAPPTVSRRLAAIGYAHRRAGLQPPQKTEGAAAIVEVLAGIRRSRGTAPGKKSAADADVTWTLLHSIQGDRLRDHRDRALIALGMAAALRRSELVALRVEDLLRVADGLRVRIVRSKTDQDGAGQVVAVPNGTRIRPVALVDAWLQAAGIVDGFVFRRFVSKADRLSDQPMDDAGVALVVKRRAAVAARAGASIWKMQEVSRHRSVQVLSSYVRSAELFDDHAGTSFL